ncbi:MAG: peroxiredoxin-like family protein [Verrucomicrobiota bacterium]
MNKKFKSGGILPAYTFKSVNGDTFTLGKPSVNGNWQLVFIYRGRHCPICVEYLARLEELREKFMAAKAEIVVVSADPEIKAKDMVEQTKMKFPVGYDLSIDQMKELGVYISMPRSNDETDRPFAEPGMFAVNSEGKVQLIDISNTPFNRADLSELLDTVEWIQDNDYPIRGTYEA